MAGAGRYASCQCLIFSTPHSDLASEEANCVIDMVSTLSGKFGFGRIASSIGRMLTLDLPSATAFL